ncbi:DUF6624 domain-containing protein [uncultured Paraglaciecola sp.]|uniref:DUF6624 domain-containing protein n=1 Tax=uncultured Paraglaciecola sp. TaxID=1765024 RepID=UPI002618458F|nr:DUF6624 domain-containing protein [uncultured Paraglaciecola sp.]
MANQNANRLNTLFLPVMVCFVWVSYSFAALAQTNTQLQQQLLKMAEQNRQIQQDISHYAPTDIPPALQSLTSNIENLHSQTLKEIIALHGWPSKSQVGEKGVLAAFSLAQHSNDLAFQQNLLPLIIQSYINKDGIEGKDVAEFTDKVSIKLGKKQVFGTQAKVVNDKVIFAPIKNRDSVDQLRNQMGMPPLAEFERSLERLNNLSQ